MFRLALLFVAFIVYGSLFPFTDWRNGDAPLFSFLFAWPASVERADIVQNVLAYAPLGLFVTLGRRESRSKVPPVLFAVACGALLSLAMEMLQQFEPSRTSSLSDLAMNVLGTLAGAVLGSSLDPRTRLTSGLRGVRATWMAAGPLPNIGIAALALWFLSQTSPLVPTFDIGQWRQALSPLWFTLHAPETVRISALLVYACNMFAVGLLFNTLMLPGRNALLPFIALLGITFIAKILVQDRQLSLEAIAGGAIAVAAMLLWRSKQRTAIGSAAVAVLAMGMVFAEQASATGPLHPDFNWVPLVGQMMKLSGLEDILQLFWPFFTMAFFVRGMTPLYRRQAVSLLGGVLVGAAMFALEWMQQDLPGRYGDITQVLVAVLGWGVPWMFGYVDYAPVRPVGRRHSLKS